MWQSRGCFALVFLCASPAWAQSTPPAGETPTAAPATAASAPADAAQDAPAPPSQIVITPPPTQPAEPAPAPPAAPPVAAPPTTPPPAAEPQEPFGAKVSGPAQTPRKQQRDFNFELNFGVNGRFGEASGYSSSEGLGAAYGAGFWFGLSDRIGLGLELLRTDLGRASAHNGQNFVTAEYATTAALLGARIFAIDVRDVRLFAALRLGLALEHVSASGVRALGTPLEPATAFDCSGTHGPAFALGAGIGALLHLNSHLDFISRLDGRAEQLTSDVVGGCAAGVGSATSLSLGVGLAYGFDGPAYKGDPFGGRARSSARR